MQAKSSIRDITPREPTLARRHLNYVDDLAMTIAGQLCCSSPAQFAVDAEEWERIAATRPGNPIFQAVSKLYADEKQRKGTT